MLAFFSRCSRKGAVGAFFCAVLCSLAAPQRADSQGWGIDACLTRHVPEDQFLPYQKLLAGAGIRIVRERDVGTRNPDGSYERDIRPECRAYREAGFFVVAFASLPHSVKLEQAGDVLPENLLVVYDQGKLLGHDFAGLVDAWEMVGEPDVGYCTDLPERTVAYQKALYLGIKAGAREAGAPAPLVLMGALALPPGPWLERATKNGLLDYTDAYNFHFYGYAEELTDVIQAHRAFLAQHQVSSLGSLCSFVANPSESSATKDHKESIGDPTALPLWITECGLKAVKPDDFLNAERRKLHADFTVSTARQALVCPDVAVFMPFILVNNRDPYALTLAADQPLPAWNAYAQFIRDHPWPARTLAHPPFDPNTLVLQWMPDNSTTLPHKVAGTYRFVGNKPIKGELFLYNFGDKPVSGRLQITVGPSVQIEHKDDWNQPYSLSPLCSFATNPSEFLATRDHKGPIVSSQVIASRPNVITIAAASRMSVPIELRQAQPGTYIHENFSALFIEDDGRKSPLSFGLESMPTLGEFIETPLGLKPLDSAMITEPGAKNFRPGDRAGVWTTVNGLRVTCPNAEHRTLNAERRSPDDQFQTINDQIQTTNSGNRRSQISDSPDATADKLPRPNEAQLPITNCQLLGSKILDFRFWTPTVENDPLEPTLAAAKLDGLPGEGFLRLQLDRPMGREAKVRLDLIDDRQQRFTIWENFGVDYYGSKNDVWLNLKDFYIYFWGPCFENPRFDPARVRELQLRFYLAKASDPLGVRLSLLRTK
jgi:hypothetical protein